MPTTGVQPPEGVEVPEELEILRLGILRISANIQYLFCLDCNKCIPGKARTHLNYPNHVGTRKKQFSRAVPLIDKYDVETGALPSLDEPINWLPALGKPEPGTACPHCKKRPNPVWFLPKEQSKHFCAHHRDLKTAAQRGGDEGYYQRLFPSQMESTYGGIIEVNYNPALAQAQPASNPTAEDVWAAARLSLKEPYRPPIMPPVEPSITTSPYIERLHWAKHLAGYPVGDLQDLVMLPTREDEFYPVREACSKLFALHQDTISKGLLVLLELWTKGAYAAHPKPLQTLEPGTCLRLANRMTSFICFMIRNTTCLDLKQQDESLTSYSCPLTAKQQELSRKILDKLPEPINHLHIQALLVSCFAPELTSFTRLSDTLQDPVQVFCMLAAINTNGQFRHPVDLTSPLSATEYLFRSTLFYELALARSDPTCNIQEKATLLHDTYLVSDQITPFGNLQSLKHLTATYAKNSARFPNANWIAPLEELNVKGKVVLMNDLKRFGRGLIPMLRNFFNEHLIFGLSLRDHYGWLFDKNTQLVDDISRRDKGYSVFSPAVNSIFEGMHEVLYHTIITHEDVKHRFYTDTDQNMVPIWKDQARQKWLSNYSLFVGKLAVAMHTLGGQPGRAKELLVQYVVNLLGYLRSLIWLKNNLCFILYYNKATATTGKDRFIAHGIPRELTDIIMPLVVLVRPLAVHWVKDLHGIDRAKVQEQSLFAQAGEPLRTEQFSQHLQELTEAGMGVSLNIPQFRHMMIAVVRRVFEENDWVLEEEGEDIYDDDDEVPEEEMDRDLMNVFEMQAGHTPPTGRREYAILTAKEWHMLSDDTVLKWIEASRHMFRWILKSPLSTYTKSHLTELDADDYVPECPVGDIPNPSRALRSSSNSAKGKEVIPANPVLQSSAGATGSRTGRLPSSSKRSADHIVAPDAGTSVQRRNMKRKKLV
ncbi:hypothetical protein FS749_001516 [Ceratobasidium sp. UAMH 11750]|nr:hypothetical protein FS749_001516 [Ceratobasidium sp. UAMH 11750]